MAEKDYSAITFHKLGASPQLEWGNVYILLFQRLSQNYNLLLLAYRLRSSKNVAYSIWMLQSEWCNIWPVLRNETLSFWRSGINNLIAYSCYRTQIRPCENILCLKDISEKEPTLWSVMAIRSKCCFFYWIRCVIVCFYFLFFNLCQAFSSLGPCRCITVPMALW